MAATAPTVSTPPVIEGPCFRGRLSPSAASAAGVASAATGLLLTDQDRLEVDPLKAQLLARAAEEIHGALRRFVGRPKLDADGLAEQVGEVFLHLPVEDEGDISVELFLQLVELALAVLPGTRLEHGQHEDILAGVVRKGIQRAGALDPGTGRGAVFATQIFAEGNHM